MVSEMSKDLEVCVVGGGVCGISAVKGLLQDGFKVSCYEKSGDYGGLWCYREEKGDVHIPSVMKTTILNTSKELSAFSDFPPPAHLPNYMKHSLYYDYIKSYVQHFQLLPHIYLRHEILTCEPEYNAELQDFKWSITIKNLTDGEVFNKKFDKLVVAVGHHNTPFAPKLPDQDKFKGLIIHSGLVKDILHDDRFIDKNVVVVGGGNSACDAAVDLAVVTNKCYASCHRGNWFYSRLTPKGMGDFEIRTRWGHVISSTLPSKVTDKQTVNRIKSRVNHQMLGLTPKHLPSESIPSINDLVPYRIFTGGITLKGSIKRMTENGCIFDGEEEECKVDVVMLATGYNARVPFLKEMELGIRSADYNGEYNLFMNIFPPKLTVSNTPLKIFLPQAMAYVGYTQPGSTTVVAELQTRLVARVFSGKRELPSQEEMLKDVERVRASRSHNIRSHSRDQLVGTYIGYLDKVAAFLGVKPNLKAIFFKDFPLWKQLMFGPSLPYQYRLEGPGSWSEARQTIMKVQERVNGGINDGKNQILFQTRRKQLNEPKST